jgi:hypothetical protein
MRIDPGSQVVHCGYCRLSSFVHLPNRPDPPPPPGSAHYGHIHVQEKALKTVGLIFGITMIAPIVIGIGITFLVVMGALFATCVAASSRSSRPAPPSPVAPAPTPASGVDPLSCQKAVACCKKVSGRAGPDAMRACEMLRALPDADCAQQLKSFRTSAASMKLQCEP